ncbi:MAG TPA: peptide deformylase [Kribbella sp.]|uniref:peptide deformylase n=1 Tax=Kribbella sp. TaxID=1871183 RepID=UPI002D767256|nr:peptide deformylase [Kribbella sp.]HET6297286.1 peptide deformylase [Kribbella sp.]
MTLPPVTDEVRRGEPLRITEVGESILHLPCREVVEFGRARWSKLIDDMFTTLWIANGCGLAANQVGVDVRLFVYDLTDEYGTRHVGHVFNPRVEASAGLFGEDNDSEGCLSLPGASARLPRPARATLHGYDLEGRPFILDAAGYFARCLQHETQHLHGQVYIDHLTPEAREQAISTSARQRPDVMQRRALKAAELGK